MIASVQRAWLKHDINSMSTFHPRHPPAQSLVQTRDIFKVALMISPLHSSESMDCLVTAIGLHLVRILMPGLTGIAPEETSKDHVKLLAAFAPA
jgi:hypothetical protein